MAKVEFCGPELKIVDLLMKNLWSRGDIAGSHVVHYMQFIKNGITTKM